MEVNAKDGICKLIISDATADMAGEIKAVAVNAGGEDLCSAALEVRGMAPTFIETPIKCTILEGKSSCALFCTLNVVSTFNVVSNHTFWTYIDQHFFGK